VYNRIVIQILLQLDNKLFTLINHLPHNLFLDWFFGFITAAGSWGIVWFLIGIAVFFLEKKKNAKILLILILATMLAYFAGEIGIKNLVRRARPQFNIAEAVLPFDSADSFSFPSGHTTIAFAAAYIFSRKHKKKAWIYYLLAAVIAFSRVYLGRHYPGDVIGGIILGLSVGYLSLKIGDNF